MVFAMSVMIRFRSAFIKLLASYVAIVILVATTIGILTYTYASSAFETEIINYNEALMKRVGESVERRVFSQAEQIWLQLVSSDDTMSLFLSSEAKLSNVEYYNTFINLEKTANLNADIIHSIEVYSQTQNAYISTIDGIKFTKPQENIFLDAYSDYSGAVMNKWMVTKNNPDCITFVRTIPYIKSSSAPIQGYLAIHVKTQVVQDIITEEIDNTDNATYIINDTGDVLVGEPAADETALIQKILQSNTTYYFEKLTHNKSTVSAIKLGNTQTYLIKQTYFNTFYKELSVLGNSLIVICLLFGIVGIFLSALFAKEIHRPLKNITNNIKYLFHPQDTEKNEYLLIDNVLSDLNHQLTSFEDIFNKNHEFIKTEILRKILTSEDPENNIDEYLAISGISFQNPLFCAIVVKISKKYAHNASAGNLEYLRFCMIETMEAASDSETIFYGTLLDANRVAIVANCHAANYEPLFKKITQLETYCKNKFQAEIISACGLFTDTIENIYDSYTAALSALEHSYLQPSKSQFLWSDYQSVQEDFVYETKEIKRFYDKLKQGNDAEVIKFIKDLCQKIKQHSFSYTSVMYIQNDMVSVLMSFMVEKSIDVSEIQPQSLFVSLRNFDSIDEFETWICEIVQIVFEKSNTSTDVKISDLIFNAKDYIDNHINLDLSLSAIAEKLYISPTYLSKMFKEEVGINFNSYVTEKKLELAKKLLLTTNESLNDIISKTGFNSANYFIKKFKERYGDSPVNYKRRYIIEKTAP